MMAREAEVRHCMGVRAIGVRLGTGPQDLVELLKSLSGTHTLVRSEEFPLGDYHHLLTFRENDGVMHIHYFIKD